jgi:hypothetical protein
MGCIVINFFTRERLNTGDETSADIPPKENNPRPRKLPETSEVLKQVFRDSLDNERVKVKYKLNPRD